jgi:3-deoxy-D-manno-octulosonate 8-phosphate phosphatase (KDO 8-P phosphatase)
MGVSLAIKAGLIVALVSGEDSPLVARFAEKFSITDVEAGCKDKARALREFAQRRGLALSEIAFMGDDVNDLSALAIAGLGAAPADAHPTAREAATLVTQRAGGRGAVRELVDSIVGKRAVASKAKSA